MRRIFFTILSLFFFIPLFSQDEKDTSTQNEIHPEHPAEFPGGTKAWTSYLIHNLNRELSHQYLKISKGEKFAKQTVKLSFEIDTDGHTSNITVDNLKDVHPALAKEAIRIITVSPVWKPASQDGKTVIDKRRQGISFVNGSFP